MNSNNNQNKITNPKSGQNDSTNPKSGRSKEEKDIKEATVKDNERLTVDDLISEIKKINDGELHLTDPAKRQKIEARVQEALKEKLKEENLEDNLTWQWAMEGMSKAKDLEKICLTILEVWKEDGSDNNEDTNFLGYQCEIDDGKDEDNYYSTNEDTDQHWKQDCSNTPGLKQLQLDKKMERLKMTDEVMKPRSDQKNPAIFLDVNISHTSKSTDTYQGGTNGDVNRLKSEEQDSSINSPLIDNDDRWNIAIQHGFQQQQQQPQQQQQQ